MRCFGFIFSLLLVQQAQAAVHDAFTTGDVLIAASNGRVQWRLPDGTINAVLQTPSIGGAAGMALDASKNLYMTSFVGQTVNAVNDSGQNAGSFGAGYNCNPQSIVFAAAGSGYVGQAGCSKQILKFNPQGALLGSFTVATENSGANWIDLAPDQCTLFYTSQGANVKRFDLCANAQLPDFNAAALPHPVTAGFRVLPLGGVLVANSSAIIRLDASGHVAQTYTVTGEQCWFALNLDPDNTSFWSADACSMNVYKFDIVSGAVLLKFNVGNGTRLPFGMTVVGEITAAGALDLLDPIATLLSGGHLTADVNVLATKGRRRDGVITDGVTQLVIRLNAPAPAAASISLVDQAGNPLTSPAEDGSLTDITGSPISAAIPTSPTVAGYKAFAVYNAPSRFARNGLPGDSQLSERRVFLKATLALPGGGNIALPPRPIRIVRSPIALVHGLWGDRTSWKAFLPNVNKCLDASGFYACVVDYAQGNPVNTARSFSIIAPVVGSQIRDILASFRKAKNIAARRVDVIAHSMGGLITRMIPLCTNLFADCIFLYGGEIDRVITIGTPHLGSPLANAIWTNRNQPCAFVTLQRLLGWAGLPVGEAIENLQENGTVINMINSVPLDFPMHFIVGVANRNDEILANQGVVSTIRKCNQNILPADIRTLFATASDLVVKVRSQRNGLPADVIGTTQFLNTIHTPAVTRGNGNFSPAELESNAIAQRLRQLIDDRTQFITP